MGLAAVGTAGTIELVRAAVDTPKRIKIQSHGIPFDCIAKNKKNDALPSNEREPPEKRAYNISHDILSPYAVRSEIARLIRCSPRAMPRCEWTTELTRENPRVIRSLGRCVP